MFLCCATVSATICRASAFRSSVFAGSVFRIGTPSSPIVGSWDCFSSATSCLVSGNLRASGGATSGSDMLRMTGDGGRLAIVGCKQLGVLGNVLLGGHVLHRCGYWRRRDGVDGSEGKTKQAISFTLNELCAELVCKLYRLVFDTDAAQDKGVCYNGTAGSTSVSIRDLPGATFGVLERRAFGRIEDSVAFA